MDVGSPSCRLINRGQRGAEPNHARPTPNYVIYYALYHHHSSFRSEEPFDIQNLLSKTGGLSEFVAHLNGLIGERKRLTIEKKVSLISLPCSPIGFFHGRLFSVSREANTCCREAKKYAYYSYINTVTTIITRNWWRFSILHRGML